MTVCPSRRSTGWPWARPVKSSVHPIRPYPDSMVRYFTRCQSGLSHRCGNSSGPSGASASTARATCGCRAAAAQRSCLFPTRQPGNAGECMPFRKARSPVFALRLRGGPCSSARASSSHLMVCGSSISHLSVPVSLPGGTAALTRPRTNSGSGAWREENAGCFMAALQAVCRSRS